MRGLLLLLLVPVTLFGQLRLTMREAVSRALAGHPLMAAGEHRVAASEGQRRQAGLAPNPTFSFQSENVRFSGNPGFRYWQDTDTFALLQQTFETKGKRKRRVESASLEVQRVELERELLGKLIANRVKRAYWAAAGAQRIHELLLETAKNFLLIVEYHEVRVREGAMAEADLMRIRLENERIALAANNASLEGERARIQLFREMGQEDIPDALEFEPLTVPAGDAASVDVSQALEQRTGMKLARLGV